MASQTMGDSPQQLWDDTLTRLIHLSSSTVKRNTDLENRVAELEVELLVWKQAHAAAHESSEAQAAQITALNRQISDLDYFKKNQNPLILCVINGNELLFDRELLQQGFQGGRLAAQEITKTIAEHLTKEEAHVYGRISFWITIYLSKADILDALVASNVCTEGNFNSFLSGFSQASARFSVVDVGGGKDAVNSKVKEYLQTFIRLPQTIRVYFGGYEPFSYITLFSSLDHEQFLGKLALLNPPYDPQSGESHVTHPLQKVKIENIFMVEHLQRPPKRLSPLATGYGVSNGGLISPQSPERLTGRVIDPNLPLHKQNPPPCNEHYLMTCSKGAGICKYSHDYILTPDQLAQLAINAKKAPCNWLKNGVPCPYGDKCCWGHICPNGPKCFHLSKGKCWFKGEAMHLE